MTRPCDFGPHCLVSNPIAAQGGALHAPAVLRGDSDSDDELEERLSDADGWDEDELEVSPEDERAMAAFMVRSCLDHSCRTASLQKRSSVNV